MIQSMTGYGKAVSEYENKKIVAEIKSLNSKQLDLSTRVSSFYREKDIEIRNEISQRVERGKVEFSVYVENATSDVTSKINTTIFQQYVEQLSQLAENSGIEKPTNWFEIILRFPEVMKNETAELTDEEWAVVKTTLLASIEQLQLYRKEEGKALHAVLLQKIDNIQQYLEQTVQYESERIDKIKQRLHENLKAIDEKIIVDENRLEQELIYYIEKLDVNEEKERLKHHLAYFKSTMQEPTSSGKKLGFIAQEIGREINTLGSKSNQSDMQRLVVLMKDELEQIKEQVLNVL